MRPKLTDAARTTQARDVEPTVFLSAMHPDGRAGSGARIPARFGQWVENAVSGLCLQSGPTVMYWREEPLEVDGLFEGSWETGQLR